MDEREPAQLAIREARSRFVDALRRGDAAAAAEVYAEDARLLPPTAELMHGREAITAFWRAGLDAGISDIALDPLELERSDGFAYEIGRYRLQLDPADGGSIVDRGKYVLVHERQADGSWRRAVEMFNPETLPERSLRQ